LLQVDPQSQSSFKVIDYALEHGKGESSEKGFESTSRFGTSQTPQIRNQF